MPAAALEKRTAERRIAAIVLPELLVEMATRTLLGGALTVTEQPRARAAKSQRAEAPKASKRTPPPLAVVLVPTDAAAADPEQLSAAARLDAVNSQARRYGVREGQSIAEASALVAGLVVRRLSLSALARALEGVAEAALGFGATVAVGPPDTVWVDVTGSAHLFGGETALGTELVSRVRAMGHAVRVAVAGGPTIARMLARWAQPVAAARGEPGLCVVPAQQTLAKMADLPVIALPLDEDLGAWLVRLGVLTVGELARLPRAALGTRLEGSARRVLELAQGRDDEPLVPFRPPRTIVEETSWEHEASGNEPLLFALRGLSARVSARLAGRGEAAQSLVLGIEHARAFARFNSAEPTTSLRFALSTPLWREEQLYRIVASRLERVKLAAPSVGLRLEVPVLVPSVARQLDFAEFMAGSQGAEDELPLIMAELVADIGEDRIGVLALVDSHRPEAQTALVPAELGKRSEAAREGRATRGQPRRAEPRRLPGAPTRLLPEAVPIQGALHVGAAFAVGERLYTVERILFEHRLEGVEWWSRSPIARDYVRLVLRGTGGFVEALAYVERQSQRAFLQAVAD